MLKFLVNEQYFCCWGIPPQKGREHPGVQMLMVKKEWQKSGL